MITPEYARTMAVYNRWQNENLYGTADALSDEVRKQQRGAFFGSIHGTLNHLVWGDQIWMSRFASTPRPNADGIPNSTTMYERWDDLKRERKAKKSDRPITAQSTEELQEQLKEALANEDYEVASKLRDEIKRRETTN